MPISRPWLDVARSAFFEDLYRGRSVLAVGVGDGRAIELLLERGAARVVGVDGDARAVAEAVRRIGRRAELHTGAPSSVAGRFDVVWVQAGEALLAAPDELRAARERLSRDGWLVVAAASGERPGAAAGAGYYQLVDALAPHFRAVTMVGQAPLAGATLAPFGEEEAEPVLDAALVEHEAEVYVAVAGPRKLKLGFGLVALPDVALGTAQQDLMRARQELEQDLTRARQEAQVAVGKAREQAQADLTRVRQEAEQGLARARHEAQEAQAQVERLRRRIAELENAVDFERRRADDSQAAELRAQLAARERGMEELREAAVLHAEELRRRDAALAERDAYVEEMQRDARAAHALAERAAAAERNQAEAEARERAARLRIAELEGALKRQPAAAPAPATDGNKLAELEARLAKAEAKAADAQRESWAHLKARSDAEAAAAEVREDTVRKLKDARKVANIELMRAMEEATKKAVQLKEELSRSEAERKEAVAALRAAREEAAGLREAAARARPVGDEVRHEIERIGAALDGEGDRLRQLEEGLRRAVGVVAAAEFDFDAGRR